MSPHRIAARVSVPSYTLGIALLALAVMMWATYAVSVKKADENAQELIDRYERDKVTTAEANRQFYCAVFGTQIDVYGEAETDVGKNAYRAWLRIYRLAKCTPER